MRDPRRLGVQRVGVQLAIGDLSDPASWRHALRGVKAVVHLAAGERDQPRATLAGPTAFATWEEAELLTVPMLSDRGTQDAERLGVTPRRMTEVL